MARLFLEILKFEERGISVSLLKKLINLLLLRPLDFFLRFRYKNQVLILVIIYSYLKYKQKLD